MDTPNKNPENTNEKEKKQEKNPIDSLRFFPKSKFSLTYDLYEPIFQRFFFRYTIQKNPIVHHLLEISLFLSAYPCEYPIVQCFLCDIG